MAATPTDAQTGRGGEKSNPQSPVLFGPATDNKPVVAVDQSLGIEEFEREIDNYIENLGSLGALEGVGRLSLIPLVLGHWLGISILLKIKIKENQSVTPK